MIRARTLTVSDMTDLEREVFEELARKNPGTKLAQLCAHTHSFEQGGRYSFSYWDEPSLVDLSPLVRPCTLGKIPRWPTCRPWRTAPIWRSWRHMTPPLPTCPHWRAIHA